MTLLQILTKARYYLDDDDKVRYPDVELTTYVNQSYRFYWNKLVNASYNGILATPASLNIVATVATIALPADFYKIKNILRVLSDKKVPLYYREGYEDYVYTNFGMSIYAPTVRVRGSNLLLNPLPQSSETGGIEVEYWPTITELSANGDIPAFNVQWHEVIPIKAAIIAKSMRDEEDVENIAAILAIEESVINDAMDYMTIQRSTVDPFIIGGGY